MVFLMNAIFVLCQALLDDVVSDKIVEVDDEKIE